LADIRRVEKAIEAEAGPLEGDGFPLIENLISLARISCNCQISTPPPYTVQVPYLSNLASQIQNLPGIANG